ncbi:MAG: M56 family metallopeptidase [Gemmataceae bacterium]
MPDLLLDPWVQIALGVSFILAIGQAFAFFCSKTPATAHAILVLALTGSLVFPLFHLTVGLADWGQLPDLALSPVQAHSNTEQDVTGQVVSPKESSPYSEYLTPKSANNETGQFTLPHEPTANLSPPETTGILENLYTGVRKLLNSQAKYRNPGIFLFLTFFHRVWGLLTAISLLLLARTFWANLRLVKTSKPVDEVSAQFLKGLAEKIGLSQVPRLREHSSVRTPAVMGLDRVWATILIPKGVTPQSYSNAVYFHELAHLKRYDSLCRLLAIIATALMPWNPLVYTVRKNIYCYAEMACDDWAVVCGTHPEEFAQELGTLVDPDASPFPALLSVASGFKELSQRLIRLKTGATASPHLQKTWILIWTIASSCLMAMAFLQPGAKPLNAKELEPTKTKDLTLFPPEKKSPDTIPSFQPTVIRATVGGKPSPDTKVWVEILDQDQFVFVGPNLTNEDGQVNFSVNPAKIQNAFALDGRGFQAWKTWEPGSKFLEDFQLDLEKPTKTKIQLLQEGKPLSGIKVELAGLDSHRLFDKYQQFPLGYPQAIGISNANGLVELESIF